jgi:hypothetical protein
MMKRRRGRVGIPEGSLGRGGSGRGESVVVEHSRAGRRRSGMLRETDFLFGADIPA